MFDPFRYYEVLTPESPIEPFLFLINWGSNYKTQLTELTVTLQFSKNIIVSPQPPPPLFK